MEDRTIDSILITGLTLTFLGLVSLITGYTIRDSRYGPVLIWAGVTTMIGVVVFYILRNLGV